MNAIRVAIVMKRQLVCLLMCIGFASSVLAQSWFQLGADIDGEAAWDGTAWSGNQVSLSSDGNRVAIGANGNDGNGEDSGQVRVYEYNGGNWIQLGADIDGEAAHDNSGFSVSLSSDGNRVAIGAPNNDGSGDNSGHVRVYEYNGENWIQLGADIDGEAPYDESGYAVSLSSDGSRVAIGADGNDANGSASGHVRVYEYSVGDWVQLGADIDGQAYGDVFGRSVSLSSDGSRLAIGSPLEQGVVTGGEKGRVRIYELSVGSWVQLGADIEGEANSDRSGGSVSLSADGNRVAIGAPYNDGNGDNSGHVRVYEYAGGVWVQMGTDIDGEALYDNLGNSVSLSSDGSRVAIGAMLNDGINGADSGHVRVYDYVGGNWIKAGADIDGEAGGDRSGSSVALSSDGNRVAVRAVFNDGNGEDSGHVRILEFGLNPFVSPLLITGSQLLFPSESNANYFILSTTNLQTGFEVMTNVVGNGSMMSIPIDFSSDTRFYMYGRFE